MRRTALETHDQFGKGSGLLAVFVGDLRFPAGVFGLLLHSIRPPAETDSPERLGPGRLPVCGERRDTAARVERADREA